MNIAEPPLNFRLWQGWVLTGEVQKAEMGSGNLWACGSGQIKLTSLGGQGIQVMLLEHSKSQGSLAEVLEWTSVMDGMWTEVGRQRAENSCRQHSVCTACRASGYCWYRFPFYPYLGALHSLQCSVTSHLKAGVRAVHCTLGAVILVLMRMHPAFCIFICWE